MGIKVTKNPHGDTVLVYNDGEVAKYNGPSTRSCKVRRTSKLRIPFTDIELCTHCFPRFHATFENVVIFKRVGKRYNGVQCTRCERLVEVTQSYDLDDAKYVW